MRSLPLIILLTLALGGCASTPAGGERSADDWYRLGNEWVEANRYEAAIDAYRAALALQPEHAQARHNMALVYLHLGVVNLLEARRALPEVDAEAAATMRYLACLMETFMGHPRPQTCEDAAAAP